MQTYDPFSILEWFLPFINDAHNHYSAVLPGGEYSTCEWVCEWDARMYLAVAALFLLCIHSGRSWQHLSGLLGLQIAG